MSVPEPGNTITIVKLREDGSEAAHYPGTVLPAAPGWVVVRAVWGRPRVDLGYLVFEEDDVFVEYFALDQPVNAFALYSPQDGLKGWYCNVAVTHLHPTALHWRDLYVDLIVYPDGRQLVLDEDELAESGLESSDPALYREILHGLELLQRLAREGAYPFSDVDVRAKDPTCSS